MIQTTTRISRAKSEPRAGGIRGVRTLGTCVCIFLAGTLFLARGARAQNTRIRPDSTIAGAESARQPIQFSASDSLVLFIHGENKSGALFGNSNVEMESSNLTAHRIDILFARNELHASGLRLPTGWIGKPEFTQGTDVFQGDSLAYNLDTERGRVVGAQTQYQEGFIRGGIVKSEGEDVMFIKDGVYTTCNCTEDPSYSLRSSRMKLVEKRWIYTGPLQLFLFNIPTPLWLPFGFLPAQDTRRSGPLPPTYGEDEYGFYLRDWGWYFAMNDHMDLQLQGGFWTRGSWEASTLFRYSKRYAFSGQLQLSYARFRSGERLDPTYSVRKTGAFRWNHSQTIDPTASFNANVNLSSSSYLRGVSQNYDDRTRQTIQSTLRLSKRWKTRNLTLQTAHNQVLATDQVTLTLPSVTFSQSSFKPFSGGASGSGTGRKVYELLTLNYNFNLNNRFSFQPLSDEALIAKGDSAAIGIGWFDALTSRSDYERATGSDEQFDFQATHRASLSAPFSISRLPLVGPFRVALSPSINYTEDWYLSTERQSLSADSSLVKENVPGFFALRRWSTAISASSTFYGLFPVRIGPYQNIRHTVRPQLSFSYQPDFSGDSYGYTRTYTNAQGEEERYPIVPGVGSREAASLRFGINNTFETKRIPTDSTAASGAANRPVKLFDVNLNSSYDLAADSLGFGNISLTARTRVWNQVDIDFRSAFSPYRTNADGRTVDRYAFHFPDSPLGRLTRASLTVRTSIRSSVGDGSRPLTNPRAGMSSMANDSFSGANAFYQNVQATDYADFSIPWSLSLDFSYGVTRNPGRSTIRRAILNTSFDFSLTPNWKIASRTGYDFEEGQLVTTNLSIARDFDCWQMSFHWVPFGDYQSWGFDLHVKSSHLADILRIQQPKSDVRNRFGGLTGQRF